VYFSESRYLPSLLRLLPTGATNCRAGIAPAENQCLCTAYKILDTTLKEEEIYWRIYDNPAHGRVCLEEFRHRYNTIRPHWAMILMQGGDPMTPYNVYVDGQAIAIPKWQGWAKSAKEKLDQLISQEVA